MQKGGQPLQIFDLFLIKAKTRLVERQTRQTQNLFLMEYRFESDSEYLIYK